MVGVFALLLLAGLGVVAQSYHPALAHRIDATPTQSTTNAPTASPTQSTIASPGLTPTQNAGTGLVPGGPVSAPTQSAGAPEVTPT
ncbi:MAG TPA: hypothetical protein VF458_06620, partial [Ktedonobacteraceae bacterium]